MDHLNLKVAVMGCAVNGPGEAKEADIGIAGGIGEGLLIRKGEIVRKVPEEELLDTLKEELLNWENGGAVNVRTARGETEKGTGKEEGQWEKNSGKSFRGFRYRMRCGSFWSWSLWRR